MTSPDPTDSATTDGDSPSVHRRTFLGLMTAAGISSPALAEALADEAEATDSSDEITDEMLAGAEQAAGIELEEDQRDAIREALKSRRSARERVQSVPLHATTSPAMVFDPLAGLNHEQRAAAGACRFTRSASEIPLGGSPADVEGPHFLPLRELGRRLRNGQLTSVELTKACLKRLDQFNDVLKCVVTLTPELALQQAETADAELLRGVDRGPLHGIPWGAKDLIAVDGYPTTWGIPQRENVDTNYHATVYERLRDAGAVLAAKLSLGALAMGDRWFRGMTRNPWNPAQGSSGSSAGSACAVAAGLLPFAVGSETLGSIVSPSRRCSATSLRPTFGRVSRFGCMPLSWTMDKLGPMARYADDLGLVLDAMHGYDAGDPCTTDRPFAWPQSLNLSGVRIGRVRSRRSLPFEETALRLLQESGATIIDIELPNDFPVWEVAGMLEVEAATMFQDMMSEGSTDGWNRWPGIFRSAHFVSAVDFLRAQRARTQLMTQMARLFESVDAYISAADLGITNLTGHPTVVLPIEQTPPRKPTPEAETDASQDVEHDDTGSKPIIQPSVVTITGGLYQESLLLNLAALLESKVQMTAVHPDESAWVPDQSTPAETAPKAGEDEAD